jgi:hypothetical protein
LCSHTKSGSTPSLVASGTWLDARFGVVLIGQFFQFFITL